MTAGTAQAKPREQRHEGAPVEAHALHHAVDDEGHAEPGGRVLEEPMKRKSRRSAHEDHDVAHALDDAVDDEVAQDARGMWLRTAAPGRSMIQSITSMKGADQLQSASNTMAITAAKAKRPIRRCVRKESMRSVHDAAGRRPTRDRLAGDGVEEAVAGRA